MESALLKKIDQLVEAYKKNHKGEPPIYVILSAEEIKEAREAIRNINGYPDSFVITTYKDLKLAEHPQLLPGKPYVSNELPETGS